MPSLLKSILAGAIFTIFASSTLLMADDHQPTATKTTQKAAKPQSTCPVMGGTIGPLDKALYVDVKGKRIYICCAACEAAIRANPDMYIKQIEERGETVADTPAPAATPAQKKSRP